MIGAACAYYPRRTGRADEWLSLAGLAAIILSIFLFTENTPMPSIYAVLPVAGTGLVLLSATPARHAIASSR